MEELPPELLHAIAFTTPPILTAHDIVSLSSTCKPIRAKLLGLPSPSPSSTPYALALVQATLGFYACLSRSLYHGALLALRQNTATLVANNAESPASLPTLFPAHAPPSDPAWDRLVLALARLSWVVEPTRYRSNTASSCLEALARLGWERLIPDVLPHSSLPNVLNAFVLACSAHSLPVLTILLPVLEEAADTHPECREVLIRGFQRIVSGKGDRSLLDALISSPLFDPTLTTPSGTRNTALTAVANAGMCDLLQLLLDYPQVDPGSNDNNILFNAVTSGCMACVDLLLGDPRVDLMARNGDVFTIPALQNNDQMMERLLLDPRFNRDAVLSTPLKEAVFRGRATMVDLILQHSRTGASFNSVREALGSAITFGNLDLFARILDKVGECEMGNAGSAWLIQLVDACHRDNSAAATLIARLLQDSSVDVGYRNNSACIRLISRGVHQHHPDLLEAFFSHPRFDPSLDESQVFHVAVRFLSVEHVARLLANPWVDPAAVDNRAIQSASRLNKVDHVALLLSDPRVDPTVRNNCILRTAANLGYREIMELLLADPRVDPTELGYELVVKALKNDHLSIVETLLADGRVPLDSVINPIFLHACQRGRIDFVKAHITHPRLDLKATQRPQPLADAAANGSLEIVQFLLEHPDICPMRGRNDALVQAIRAHHPEVVNLLLAEPRIDPSYPSNLPLFTAALHGAAETVARLLKDPRVNPNTDIDVHGYGCYGRPLSAAVWKGHAPVVRLLLSDPRIDPTYANQLPIREAAALGHDEVVEALVSHPDVDVTVFDNFPLRDAALRGRDQVVRVLLSHPDVDPTAKFCAAFRKAAAFGRVDIVTMMLQDPRVDPTIHHNEALRVACRNNRVGVVIALLNDPRVDPSDRDNEALIWAVTFSRRLVVIQLLQHPRVDPQCRDGEPVRIAQSINHFRILPILQTHITNLL